MHLKFKISKLEFRISKLELEPGCAQTLATWDLSILMVRNITSVHWFTRSFIFFSDSQGSPINLTFTEPWLCTNLELNDFPKVTIFFFFFFFVGSMCFRTMLTSLWGVRVYTTQVRGIQSKKSQYLLVLFTAWKWWPWVKVNYKWWPIVQGQLEAWAVAGIECPLDVSVATDLVILYDNVYLTKRSLYPVIYSHIEAIICSFPLW
jgi:hypothetical protein